jgi:hypothetical protein
MKIQLSQNGEVLEADVSEAQFEKLYSKKGWVRVGVAQEVPAQVVSAVSEEHAAQQAQGVDTIRGG